eukprot:scaffold2639_cov361-Pavlova_lutheri.AAC.71
MLREFSPIHGESGLRVRPWQSQGRRRSQIEHQNVLRAQHTFSGAAQGHATKVIHPQRSDVE